MKRRLIVDPDQLSRKEIERILAWCRTKMNKIERKLQKKWDNQQIIDSGTIDPEEIDAEHLYSIAGLYYYVFKRDNKYHIMVCCKGDRVICTSAFKQKA